MQITRRQLHGELMDDPGVDRDDLRRSLAFIRTVNRRLGGTAAALRHLQRLTQRWPRDRPIRVIDVGTGSADIPLAMSQWAKQAGRTVNVVAVDLHETTIELAREHVDDCADIEIVQADALRLMDRYEPGSFDIAHAGMFLHHLQDVQVLAVLRIMDRLAARGIIWNDLIRGALPRLGVRLLTLQAFGVPAMVRHDAIVSIEAGFTRSEALDLAKRVGLEKVRYQRHLLHRFTLVSEKHGG